MPPETLHLPLASPYHPSVPKAKKTSRAKHIVSSELQTQEEEE